MSLAKCHEVTKKVEHPMYEERLIELGFFWPGEEEAQEDVYKYIVVFMCIST